MPPYSESVISLRDVCLDWPDGTSALSNLTASFGVGHIGVVGANGSGKSTLLKVVAGKVVPTSGSVTVGGETAYLPQDLTLQTDATVTDLLGIRARLDALSAIEAGSTDPADYETLGDNWDVEARAHHVLAEAGIGSLGLDRDVDTLSGGEVMLTAIAGLRLRDAPITLLDEPTNNLDRAARTRLYSLIRNWPGTLLVVSHDTALLELMDTTAELRDNEITLFGGPLSEYREQVRLQQESAHQDLRSAQQDLKVQQRQRIDTETKVARRSRYGKNNTGLPKILLGARKRSAQETAGRLRSEGDNKINDARRAIESAAELIRDDKHIRIELPDPDVPAGRRLAEIHSGDSTIVVAGPERVALSGTNGSGKTTLLRTLWNPDPPEDGPYAVAHTDHIGYLAQRLDDLDDAASVLDNVRSAVPDAEPNVVRARLAQFLLRGDAVDRLVGELSGGERFRVALARLLLATPPVQLLVLDEPTNNLDIDSVDQLVEALSAYRGGMLVVSHDDGFLARLGISRSLVLSGGVVESGELFNTA
ncbi:ABC-F family ATP-binding cassette domain-containing protein [Nocardia sp. 348MFTsu5.1]|uniref:ABC-F family ATP-binding cassette domain-containing protein n=1 Tax=Nocardia sp. 348MFTsu5.1 TaxID=1172185 RepID=UPI00036D0C2B|nr:ABC-F family ATP-binding cassette domain-containing protein [Nocardia sp. 348MFTsu5.1]